MSTRLVSIDVEPGGVERPAGYIGVTVLDGARVVESTLYRFLRPDVLYTWDDWCASMRVRALQQWMRMDEAERDELRWVGGDALVESDPEMARILNEYPSERHEPEPFRPAPAPFAAVWPEVAAIVQSGYVAAYGARYDRRQLHELIGLAGLTQPALEWLDGMEAIRHLGRVS